MILYQRQFRNFFGIYVEMKELFLYTINPFDTADLYITCFEEKVFSFCR